jgi:hypothetical protein
MVDRMSRAATTTVADKRLLDSFKLGRIPDALDIWMKNPSENWLLPEKLLEHVECRISHDKKVM